MRHRPVNRHAKPLVFAATALLAAGVASSFTPKGSFDELDLLVYIDPQLRLVETTADADDYREDLSAIAEMDAFRAQHGDAWRFTIDLRRGVPTLLGGGAIPFIPGNANELAWDDFAPGCSENGCLPVDVVEPLARSFIDQHELIFGVRSGELVLAPNGSGPFGASIYLLRFQWTVDGIAVENASVFFRINNGNLIQVATQNVGNLDLDTEPSFARIAAIGVVEAYLGPFGGTRDKLIDEGSLHIVPVTPAGQDPDEFTAAIGAGIEYRLAWRFAFQRDGVIGTWEALVDAHSGELIRFVDSNRYGRVHGGAYPGDNHTGEADRTFPFADTGLPAPNEYADSGGMFPGDNATVTLQGKYCKINDSCGAINNTTTTGDVDFSLGSGTDCAVPTGNTGGPGNTHSARTQYYHLTAANLRAQSYLPGNTWLQTSFITVNTNQSPWCNATSGGDTLNFYRADTGCWNLGEIPGVALHEWGHSLDDFDDSGGDSRPVETYADWMAALHLHDSCVGRGFRTSGNCGGYGDACINCSGIRDMDYTQHAGNTPWTAANYGSLWNNSGTSYYGPCGLGAHAEAGISEQALWDFVNRKVTAPPYNLDLRSAWLLADHLWYHGISTLGYNMYNCSIPSSDGCNGGSLYYVMLAIDDDGDGIANGTPHAAAIFSALDDHNIACFDATHPQNQDQTSCPSIGSTTLSGQGQNNSAEISWTSVTNATRYLVFRNDISCDAGMTKIAEVSSPTTSYTDDTVVNDISYYYTVQAATDSDSCVGPISNCVIVTPVPCTTPGAPSNLTASAAGDNQISLSWTSSDPSADSFNVYRAVGTCPQTLYELIESGLSTTSYLDTTVSGGIDYSYVVTAEDITGGCESVNSGCADAQTTGTCTEAPGFAGLQSVTNAGLSTCTLELDWNAGVDYCGGPLSYNVYRSTTPGFVPGGGNRIATGIVATQFSDDTGIDFEVDYYYVVRAVDESNAAEDDNLVELSGSPTGPISIGSWTDDAGDTGTAQLLPTTPWNVDPTGGNTGPKVYATGFYPNLVCAGLTTPSLQLDASSQLSFWSTYDIEDNWDKGEVQISIDGGSSWQRLPVNYPDYANRTSDQCGFPTGDYFSGLGSTYAEYTASLSSWNFDEVLIRWVLSTDTSVNGAGWWVDDITITNVDVPTACSSSPSPLPGSFAKSAPANGATDQPTDPTLSWGTSTDATSYEYCYDTVDNNACDGSWINVGASTGTNLSGLATDTSYFWQVRAVNTEGSTEADSGSWWQFTTMPLPGGFGKNAPANGATDQPTDPTLSWGTSTDATSYEYCYDTVDNDACDGSWINVGASTGTNLSGLATDTSHFWQVRAVNTEGSTEADSGSWWQFTTMPLPGGFGKNAPANGATDQPTDPTLSWGTSTDATSYEYCYDTVDNDACDGSWTDVGASTGTNLSGLATDTSYFWQVRAVNSEGSTEADSGAWWQFTTMPLPGGFGKNAPANGATDQPTDPTLSWGTSTDATSYEYCYDTVDNDACDGSWTDVGASTGTNLSGLATDTSYFWQVRAVNSEGSTEADSGAWWQFTTMPLPGAFGKSAPADGATDQLTELTLIWGTSSDAVSYEYCNDTVDNDACDGSWTNVGANTSTNLSGLDMGTSYFWQVRAINTEGSTQADGGSWWGFTTDAMPFVDGFESGDTSAWSYQAP